MIMKPEFTIAAMYAEFASYSDVSSRLCPHSVDMLRWQLKVHLRKCSWPSRFASWISIRELLWVCTLRTNSETTICPWKASLKVPGWILSFQNEGKQCFWMHILERLHEQVNMLQIHTHKYRISEPTICPGRRALRFLDGFLCSRMKASNVLDAHIRKTSCTS